jgi:pimeloyl-ACP methyl ester carboxylesterase
MPLLQLVGSGVPVVTAYGDKDSITPLHQGELLEELVGIPVIRLQGAGHVSYDYNGGKDFAQVRQIKISLFNLCLPINNSVMIHVLIIGYHIS